MAEVSPEPREVVKLDLSVGSLHTVLLDGAAHVVLKPAVEALGLSYAAQYRKLQTRSWASIAQTAMQMPGDDQVRQVITVTVRTFLMLLANVNENRVKDDVRAVLVAFQNETADAVEAYWTRGGAINPAASDGQLVTLADEIEAKRLERCLGLVRIIAAMDDTIDPKWKRTRQLHHYGEASGEIPEIPAQDRALTVEAFLNDKGCSAAERRSLRSPFGRRVSLAFEMTHNRKPKDSFGLVDGRERAVKSYTETDRPLMDKVWTEFYADRYPAQPQLLDGAA